MEVKPPEKEISETSASEQRRLVERRPSIYFGRIPQRPFPEYNPNLQQTGPPIDLFDGGFGRDDLDPFGRGEGIFAESKYNPQSRRPRIQGLTEIRYPAHPVGRFNSIFPDGANARPDRPRRDTPRFIRPRPIRPGPIRPRPNTPRPSTPRPGTARPGTPRPRTPRPGTPRPDTPRPSTPRPSTPRSGG